MKAFRRSFLVPSQTLSDVLRNMNDTGFRAAIVVDGEERMLGLITDGDVRKSLLKGTSLDALLTEVMNPEPTVGPLGLPREEYLPMMVEKGNECLPIVDAEGKVVDMVFMRDFVPPESLKSSMVIMAGGAGKRLWPLTMITPKPLLPVANKPILQHILAHARAQGFKQVWVSTHYKAEQVENFLNTSTPVGMEANILREENPLGTAGCLKALEDQSDDRPIFIMNGDILTQLDFQAMLDWHVSHGNLLTVTCRQFSHQVPYGVLETEGQRLVSVREKPTHFYNINAGIYLMEREALRYIPEEVHFDMTDLIDALIHANRPVGTFPISESWIDIGQHEDYERVNRDSHQFLSPVGSIV